VERVDQLEDGALIGGRQLLHFLQSLAKARSLTGVFSLRGLRPSNSSAETLSAVGEVSQERAGGLVAFGFVVEAIMRDPDASATQSRLQDSLRPSGGDPEENSGGTFWGPPALFPTLQRAHTDTEQRRKLCLAQAEPRSQRGHIQLLGQGQIRSPAAGQLPAANALHLPNAGLQFLEQFLSHHSSIRARKRLSCAGVRSSRSFLAYRSSR
jgi:hypothetical protein